MTIRSRFFLGALLITIIIVGCLVWVLTQNESSSGTVYVGWRSSVYGHQQDKPPSYWVDVAEEMSSRFDDSQPSGIWIVGVLHGSKVCYLQFPNRDGAYHSNIEFASDDQNEEYLDAFDNAGVKVWLQVEPGNADVDALIDLVLNEYKHHSCVIGFGVDVEWLESDPYINGRRVTNKEATEWLERVKSHNSSYTLFLKHWRPDRMPSIYPADIVFINDGCDASNMDEMVDWFKSWGNTFSDAKVGFQVGYDLDTNGDDQTDKDWWSTLEDPPKEIGDVLIDSISNCEYIYWVDFTILDVFP